METKSPHILKMNHEKSGNFYFWETTLSLVFRYPGICSHFLLPSGVFGWKTERQWLKPKVVFNGQNSRHFRRLVGRFFFLSSAFLWSLAQIWDVFHGPVMWAEIHFSSLNTFWNSLQNCSWFYLCFCSCVLVGELKVPVITCSKKMTELLFSLRFGVR